MDLTITLTGISTLLTHNIRLADPDDDYAAAIKRITDKRRMTEDDRRQKERLDWYGGLYTDTAHRIVYPTAGVRKCLVNAAKVSRLGTAVARGLIVTDGLHVPLDHPAPPGTSRLTGEDYLEGLRTYGGKGLLSDGRINSPHVDRRSVGVGPRRVVRVRPAFPDWSLTIHVHLLVEVLDLEQLRQIVTAAGIMEGLGDNRINGFGRFKATVTPQ